MVDGWLILIQMCFWLSGGILFWWYGDLPPTRTSLCVVELFCTPFEHLWWAENLMGGLSQESGVRRGKEKANCHFDSSLHFYSVYYVAFLFLPITDWLVFSFSFFFSEWLFVRYDSVASRWLVVYSRSPWCNQILRILKLLIFFPKKKKKVSSQ